MSDRRVQGERQGKDLDSDTGQQRARKDVAQPEGAIGNESVERDEQGDHDRRTGDETDDCRDPLELKECGAGVDRNREDDRDDQQEHHHEPHQALAQHVALGGSKDLGEGEFHRREYAARAPQQTAE